jgi:hypothetical protein
LGRFSAGRSTLCNSLVCYERVVGRWECGRGGRGRRGGRGVREREEGRRDRAAFFGFKVILLTVETIISILQIPYRNIL